MLDTRPRSSTAEQLTLNQLVVGSNPTGVTHQERIEDAGILASSLRLDNKMLQAPS